MDEMMLRLPKYSEILGKEVSTKIIDTKHGDKNLEVKVWFNI